MSQFRGTSLLILPALLILHFHCAASRGAQATVPRTGNSGAMTTAAGYPNTADGLRAVITDMLEATKRGDPQTLNALMKQTEFADYAQYFARTYTPDPFAAEDWDITYRRYLADNEQAMRDFLGTLAKDDSGTILVRKVNDDPAPGKGFEWALVHYARIPIDVYRLTLVFHHSPESAGEFIGYYVYADGMFRWDSIVPFARPGTYQFDPGQLDVSQTSTAGSAQYPNTQEGLQGFLNELISATKSGDQAKVTSMIKLTEIPEYRNWFCSVYIPGSGLSWAIPYGKMLPQNEQVFKDFLERLAKNDGDVQIRKLVDKPGGDRGWEWGMLHNSRIPLDIYHASLKSKNSAADEWSGYFIYIDGMFRLQNSGRRIAVTRVSRAPSPR